MWVCEEVVRVCVRLYVWVCQEVVRVCEEVVRVGVRRLYACVCGGCTCGCVRRLYVCVSGGCTCGCMRRLYVCVYEEVVHVGV